MVKETPRPGGEPTGSSLAVESTQAGERLLEAGDWRRRVVTRAHQENIRFQVSTGFQEETFKVSILI